MTGWKSCDSVPKLVEDYLAGKLKVDEFITHTMPLDKINEAFDLMHAGKRFDHTVDVISWLCFVIVVLHCTKLRRSRVMCTWMRLRRSEN